MAKPGGPLAYRVVVRGIKPEHAVDQVVDVLSRLVKKPPEILRPLLDGRKTVFMRTGDPQRASAYRRTLEMLGCACSVETEAPPPPPANETNDHAFTVNFATSMITSARGRDFQFVQRPTAREMVVNYVRANRIALGIALVLLLYLAYKFFPELG
jgi:hypothetical protein